MTTPIDLSQLPAPDVIEPLNYEALLAERKVALLALYPVDQQAELAATLALESEPLTLLLQENTYRELLLRQRINDAARGVMLAFAQGSDLDHLAALFGVKRLVIQHGDPQAVPPVENRLESDHALRERTQGALEGFSTAGPRGAYIMHARAADGRVADASAVSPAPAEVVVTILSNEDEGHASDDLLKVVHAALNDEAVRPVGDRLTVQTAEIVRYMVNARLHLFAGPASEPILQAAQAQLDAYVTQQRRLGRDIRRSALFAALHGEGVQRVDLLSPADDIILDEMQAGTCQKISLTVAGQDAR